MHDTDIELTDNISEADALLALQSKLKKNPGIQAAAKSHETPIYVTKVINFPPLWDYASSLYFQFELLSLSHRHARWCK